jgi:hypothetical protein
MRQRLGRLKQFPARIPVTFKTENGFDLGVWVTTQRQKKAYGEFNYPDRQQRLEALPGWSWAPGADRAEERWEKGFANLKHFLNQHDHSEIPFHYKTDDGFLLGRWVSRVRLRQKTLDLDRTRRLEALPGWSWSKTGKAVWGEHFADLKQYSEREGHSRVPFNYRTQDGFGLGQWVSTQRINFNKDRIAPDRRQRLEALPGWVWKTEKRTEASAQSNIAEENNRSNMD